MVILTLILSETVKESETEIVKIGINTVICSEVVRASEINPVLKAVMNCVMLSEHVSESVISGKEIVGTLIVGTSVVVKASDTEIVRKGMKIVDDSVAVKESETLI